MTDVKEAKESKDAQAETKKKKTRTLDEWADALGLRVKGFFKDILVIDEHDGAQVLMWSDRSTRARRDLTDVLTQAFPKAEKLDFKLLHDIDTHTENYYVELQPQTRHYVSEYLRLLELTTNASGQIDATQVAGGRFASQAWLRIVVYGRPISLELCSLLSHASRTVKEARERGAFMMLQLLTGHRPFGWISVLLALTTQIKALAPLKTEGTFRVVAELLHRRIEQQHTRALDWRTPLFGKCCAHHLRDRTATAEYKMIKIEPGGLQDDPLREDAWICVLTLRQGQQEYQRMGMHRTRRHARRLAWSLLCRQLEEEAAS